MSCTSNHHEREAPLAGPKRPVRVGGVPVETHGIEEALRRIRDTVEGKYSATTFRFVNAYSVVVANSDTSYREILMDGGINFPDGRPVACLARLKARQKNLVQVRGPEVFRHAMTQGALGDARQFIVGGNERTRQMLQEIATGANIVGHYCPPYGPPTEEYIQEIISQTIRHNPDIVWVALGGPKQDLVANRIAQTTQITTSAIGAALDFVTLAKSECPEPLRKAGFEWLYRLACEPTRLWRRYVLGNPKFIYHIIRTELESSRTRSSVKGKRSSSEPKSLTTQTVIVDQNDPTELATSGGIATCIRGQAVHMTTVPKIVALATSQESIGIWQVKQCGGAKVELMYVAKRSNLLPDSLALALGMLRHRSRLRGTLLQVHRAEIGLVSYMMRRPYTLLLHNDAASLTDSGSDSTWRRLGTLYKVVERIAVRRSLNVGVFSGPAAERLSVIRSDVVRLYTSYDGSIFYPRKKEPATGPDLICWVGRLDSQKDPELMLDVARSLRERGVPITIEAYGDGPLRDSLAERISREQLPVRLNGSARPLDVAAAMRNSKLLLMTSRYEGSPTVLIEALATGTPVVASAESDPDKVICAKDTGEIVRSRSPEEISLAIINRIARPTGSEACSAAVRHREVNVQVSTILQLSGLK